MATLNGMGGVAVAAAVVVVSATAGVQAQSLADTSPPTMDASGLIAALDAVSTALRGFVSSMASVPDALAGAISWVGTGGGWGTIVAFALLLAAAGWAAMGAATALAGLEHSFRRLVVGAAAFLATGFLLHLVLPIPDRARAVSFAFFLGIAFVVVGTYLVRFVLVRSRAPDVGALSNLASLQLGLIATGYVVLGLMRLSGGPVEARLAVGMIIWIAMVCVAAVFVVRFSRELRRQAVDVHPTMSTIGHDPITRLLSRQSGWFFGTMLGLIAGLTVVSALRESPRAFLSGTLAILLLAALPAAMSLLPLPRIGTEGDVQPWRATVRRCGRLVVFIAFWLVLAWLFDIDLFAVASDRFGEAAVRVLIDVGIAVALGYLLWQVASAILDGISARATAEGPQGASHPSSRIETFVPLLRTIAVAFIVVSTGMIVLASMGVNIGPLLAGAGIFGIAIGFGSQALVKDVISGLFFLADDAFRLGEYVEVGGAKGTVESISIRSMKLRHSRGAIYTVPFGQVGVVNNQSRDWAIVKLEFLVDFETDLRRAKTIVREIGADLSADPELGKSLLAPVKFQGVRRMEPFGMVVGVKFTAIPGEQFVLRREVYARVRDAFADADIHFARPRVQVHPASGPATPEMDAAGAMVALPPADPAGAAKAGD